MFQSSTKPVFLVDGMLGNIAKKLRLLGFDSEYSSNSEDQDLILWAKKEGRVLITKDTLLSEMVIKQDVPVIHVTESKEIEQLVQIFKKIDLSKVVIAGDATRCTECNGELKTISKDEILNKVPEGVLEQISDFWKCVNCDKIYWEGTHIERLQKFVAELNEKL